MKSFMAKSIINQLKKCKYCSARDKHYKQQPAGCTNKPGDLSCISGSKCIIRKMKKRIQEGQTTELFKLLLSSSKGHLNQAINLE